MRFAPWLLVLGCASNPGPNKSDLGGQSGSLREELPLPADLEDIDYEEAVDHALEVAAALTAARLWDAHADLVGNSSEECPAKILGPLEDNMMDGEFSWLGACAEEETWNGNASWTAESDLEGASRSLFADATISRDGDTVLVLDGEFDDSLNNGVYTSTVVGEIHGSAIEDLGSLRVDLQTSWGGESTSIQGKIYAYDNTLGERFDSAVIDVSFAEGCSDEPVGYVGLRGRDGYWFDIYFQPLYEEDDVAASAFPFPEIDNVSCDGCGHLFVRNVSVQDVGDICPSFDVLSDLAIPDVQAFTFTTRDLLGLE